MRASSLLLNSCILLVRFNLLRMRWRVDGRSAQLMTRTPFVLVTSTGGSREESEAFRPGPSDSRAIVTAPHAPASAPGGRTARSRAAGSPLPRAMPPDPVEPASDACQHGSPAWLMPPPITIRSTSYARTRQWMPPGDGAAGRFDDRLATGSPAAAAAKASAARRRDRRRARRRCRRLGRDRLARAHRGRASVTRIAGPAAIVSKQPRLPQAQSTPSGSTTTWPISPASPWAPRWNGRRGRRRRRSPSRSRGDQRSTEPNTRRRWRPRAAARTSFSTTHGTPSAASSAGPAAGVPQRLTASVTWPAPVSTRPGTPTPRAATSAVSMPASPSAPTTSSAIASAARVRCPRPSGRWSGRSTLPSRRRRGPPSSCRRCRPRRPPPCSCRAPRGRRPSSRSGAGRTRP